MSKTGNIRAWIFNSFPLFPCFFWGQYSALVQLLQFQAPSISFLFSHSRVLHLLFGSFLTFLLRDWSVSSFVFHPIGQQISAADDPAREVQDQKTLTHRDQLHGLNRLNRLHNKATIPVASKTIPPSPLRFIKWVNTSRHSNSSPSCVNLSERDFVRENNVRSGERSRTLGRPVILGTDAMITAILNLPARVSAACSSFSNPLRHPRKSAASLRHFRLAFSVPFQVLRLEAPTGDGLDSEEHE